VLKRLKYRQPIYQSDNEHFHHRMARIGFSSRRTIAYLYVWTMMLAGLALAIRFIPYSDHKGHFDSLWSLVLVGLGLAPRYNYLVQVRGRKTGRVYAAPVNLLDIGGRRSGAVSAAMKTSGQVGAILSPILVAAVGRRCSNWSAPLCSPSGYACPAGTASRR